MFAQHPLLRIARRTVAGAAVAGLAVAMFAGIAPTMSAAAAAPLSAKLTSDQLLVGGHFAPASNWYMAGQKAEIDAAEDSFGRTFDLVQSYYQFEMPFPTWKETWNMEQGRTPVIAWNGIRDAASVGAGAYDDMIRTNARGVAALGGPVVIRFAWEMDGEWNPFKPDTVAGYIAEWRRVHQLFEEEGATNVIWMWCPNAWGIDNGDAQPYYPGDDVVDWVGADGYDFAPIKARATHQSFERIFIKSYEWAKTRGKPFAIGEFGALEDSPTYKADWYDAARRSLTGALAGTKAVINWSNRDGTYDDPSTFYNYRYDTTPAAEAAWARWSTATNRPPAPPAPQPWTGQVVAATGRSLGGLWTASNTGTVSARAGAPHLGQLGSPPSTAVVGVASTSSGAGYRLVTTNGSVFGYGDAAFYGSTAGLQLNKPIVGMASTPTGRGYWLVASDGGIFSFGDAAFFGSTGAFTLNKPIVGMASTPTGRGYWLVASDGGIFAFGDAGFFGSTGAVRLVSPISGIATSPTGRGYRMVAADGGAFSFGDATFHGSLAGTQQPVAAMASTLSGRGYWLLRRDNSVVSFGDAPAA